MIKTVCERRNQDGQNGLQKKQEICEVEEKKEEVNVKKKIFVS